jgi:tetratricopeptide (TPR) repeat protein
MATLQSDDANLLDQEPFNWRLIVYPALVIFVVVCAGLAWYFQQLQARETREETARAALVKAKTPADFLAVAAQYPKTDQATLALISAGQASFDAHDYPGAVTAYQKVTDDATTDPELRDTAQLGRAAALEASGKTDDAVLAYMEVAQRGSKSAFAPFAYNAVAHVYDDRGDKDHERKILTEAAGLDPNSLFTKQAQAKLRTLTPPPAEPASPAIPTAGTPPASATSTPSPTAPAPAASAPPTAH